MPDQDLKKMLERIDRAIESAKSVDEEGQTRLREVREDIQDLLERSEKEDLIVEQSTFERLDESIAYFEVSHPDLTLLLSELATILSNAGI
jgi:ribosome recycling factor